LFEKCVIRRLESDSSRTFRKSKNFTPLAAKAKAELFFLKKL